MKPTRLDDGGFVTRVKEAVSIRDGSKILEIRLFLGLKVRKASADDAVFHTKSSEALAYH